MSDSNSSVSRAPCAGRDDDSDWRPCARRRCSGATRTAVDDAVEVAPERGQAGVAGRTRLARTRPDPERRLTRRQTAPSEQHGALQLVRRTRTESALTAQDRVPGPQAQAVGPTDGAGSDVRDGPVRRPDRAFGAAEPSLSAAGADAVQMATSDVPQDQRKPSRAHTVSQRPLRRRWPGSSTHSES